MQVKNNTLDILNVINDYAFNCGLFVIHTSKCGVRI